MSVHTRCEIEGIRLTRRKVLAAVLGAVTTAAVDDPLSAASAERWPVKIGCGTVSFRKQSLREAMERIRRAGYKYVEPQATGPWCPHVDVWKSDSAEFRRLLTEFGFEGATALWAPDGALIPNPKSLEGVSQALRWAHEAGIAVVNCGDGRKPQTMSDADALKVLGERLAAILEVAEKCQVYLAIEPHGTFSVTDEGLKKIMGFSRSKWLGINYDTANVHHAGSDEVATLRAVVERVVHVHVKDTVAHKCVALGQGEVNLRGCLQVLKQHGYAGVLSLETEGDFEAEQVQTLIAASRQYLVNAVAEV
jgi:sugar phosphate isomerase/epimerase